MDNNTPNKAVEITDANFAQTLKSDQPVLVDFWAAWCGPCQVLGPVIDELAQETTGQFVVGKLDVDQNSRTAAQHSIRSIPTLIIFKNGQEVDRLMGIQTKAVLKANLAKYAG